MLKITQHLTTAEAQQNAGALASLTLPYDKRVISRQRVTLDDSRDAGLFLPRGTVLQQGDVLQAETGEHITIKAAQEQVSSVYCDDALMLARACYHLGNRHVAVQISLGMIRYQHDHVLDAMLEGFGLSVKVEQASFEPESGAYSAGHGHGHGHGHDDHHTHDHHHHEHHG